MVSFILQIAVVIDRLIVIEMLDLNLLKAYISTKFLSLSIYWNFNTDLGFITLREHRRNMMKYNRLFFDSF